MVLISPIEGLYQEARIVLGLAPRIARVGVVLDVIGLLLVSAITATLVPVVWN